MADSVEKKLAILEKAKEHIKRGLTQKAFEELEKLGMEKTEEEITILSGRFHAAERQHRLKLIISEAYDTIVNHTHQGLLAIIRQAITDLNPSDKNKSNKRKQKGALLLGCLVLVMLGGIGYVLYSFYQCQSSKYIVGSLKSREGKTLEDVAVTLLNCDPIQTVSTDEQGRFVFEKVSDLDSVALELILKADTVRRKIAVDFFSYQDSVELPLIILDHQEKTGRRTKNPAPSADDPKSVNLTHSWAGPKLCINKTLYYDGIAATFNTSLKCVKCQNDYMTVDVKIGQLANPSGSYQVCAREGASWSSFLVDDAGNRYFASRVSNGEDSSGSCLYFSGRTNTVKLVFPLPPPGSEIAKIQVATTHGNLTFEAAGNGTMD